MTAPLFVVTFTDVNGSPKASNINLSSNLKIGDSLALRLRLTRTSHGRSEVCDVEGTFRVLRVSYDATRNPSRTLVDVESAGKPPTWRSVRKDEPTRLLAPTHSRGSIPPERLESDEDYPASFSEEVL